VTRVTRRLQINMDVTVTSHGSGVSTVEGKVTTGGDATLEDARAALGAVLTASDMRQRQPPLSTAAVDVGSLPPSKKGTTCRAKGTT
jgi:hypothetical protein